MTSSARCLAVLALLAAGVVRASGEDRSSPQDAVRELLADYAAGDVEGVARRWVAGEPAESFVRAHARRMRVRCRRLESLAVAPVSITPETAVVETRETFAVWSDAARPVERAETSSSRFRLRRDGDRWRIEAWESLEAELVERLVAAGSAAERSDVLTRAAALRTPLLVRLLSLRAVNLMNQGRLELAGGIVAAASALAWELGDPGAESMAAGARTMELRQRGERDFACDLAEDALAAAETTADPDVIGYASLRFSRAVELRWGVIDVAPLQRVLANAEGLEDISIAAKAASELARLYDNAWQPADGFVYAQLASRYAEAGEDRAAQVSAALNLAGSYFMQSDVDLAARHYQRAAELAVKAGFDDAAISAMTIAATISEDPRKMTAVLAFLEDARRRMVDRPEAVPELSVARAEVLFRLDRIPEAEEELARTYEVSPEHRRAHLLMSRIRLEQGRYGEALEYAEAARAPNRLLNQWARHTRAKALRCLGRTEESLREFEELVEETEDVPPAAADGSRAVFLHWGPLISPDFIEMLVELGDPRRALQVAEKKKGLTLAQSVVAGPAGRAVLTAEQRRRDEQLQTRVHEANKAFVSGISGSNMDELRRGLREAREELTDFRARRAAGSRTPPPKIGDLDVDALPAALDDVTLVQYMVGEEQVTVFVVHPRSEGRRVSAHFLPIPHRELVAEADRLARSIEQRNYRAAEYAAGLYERLVAPIEPALRPARMLCIIPDAELWRVPFHVLGPAGGEALVDRVALFYAPSLSVLTAASARRAPRPAGDDTTLLALANPVVAGSTASRYRSLFRDAVLGALPDTESEVRSIAALYGAGRSRVLIGADAREKLLKDHAGDYRVLHIATHGMVDDRAPMFSSLVLATSSADALEDGLLEAREIVELDLQADLAVFSACDTGRARVSGAGLISFSWAMLAAGCPTTVVSQWKAHSAATARMMVELHRQLVSGVLKPEALRRAQLALRRDRRYRHPFYWAPFVVVGAP